MEAAASESMADEMALTALTASKVGAHPESGTEGAALTSFTLFKAEGFEYHCHWLCRVMVSVVNSRDGLLLFLLFFTDSPPISSLELWPSSLWSPLSSLSDLAS